MCLRDVPIAKGFAHHRAVLGLGQRIVIAAPGARFGELHPQLLQQLRHLMIDVLRAIVGMKAQDAKRKLLEHLFDHRQQISLADALATAHHLPLRHAIDSVDVIDAFEAIPITLVHAVDADEPRATLGCRRFAHADAVVGGPRALAHDALFGVGGAGAQVVQVRDRDASQALEARIGIDGKGAAQQVCCGRSREGVELAVHFGQQGHTRV